MYLKDYLEIFTSDVSDYSKTGLIMTSNIKCDFRSEKIGFLKGKIVFLDKSVLFFKEYLDLRYQIDKKTYSFHYQDKNTILRFRYDNALHKPKLGFNDHKHVDGRILKSNVPTIKDVLKEIADGYL